jgi:hypothetical protein
MTAVYLGKHTIFDHTNTRYLRNLIENEEESKITSDEGKGPLSLRLKKFLRSSGLGDMKNVAVSVISLIICFSYAVDTYITQDSIRTLIETFLLLCLVFDIILNMYLAESKLFFLIKTETFIDYISVIPAILIRINLISNEPYIKVLQILNFLRIQRFESFLAKKKLDL